MRRILLITAIAASLLACGSGLALARSAALARFIAPGAADVRVKQQGIGRATITYQAAGDPYAWRDLIARRLDRSGWSGHAYTTFGGSGWSYTVLWYSRELRVGPIAMTEYAVLGGDPDHPNQALIRLSFRMGLASR